MQISFNHYNKHDMEYQRIIQQLMALGISPSGNKNTDKARLQIEKEKLVNKIAEQGKQENNFLETLVQVNEDNYARQALEEQRIGAMSIAELNKYLLGL